MTSLGWSIADVVDAVDGTLVGDGGAVINEIVTDSREATPGSLFVALVGEHFDGNHFATSAVERGASCVLTRPGVRTEPRIEVDDTSDALLALAAKRRAELSIPVIAVTGSTGKTSTKDLLHAGIAGSWASPRSYNNEVGVPLTVLATPDDATALILEVGSRGVGHIAWLRPAIEPDIAIITNLGLVHLETFGSEDGLADAKYELVAMLPPDGTAVLPHDEVRLRREGEPQTLTFGEGGEATVSVSRSTIDGEGYPTFRVSVEGDDYDITLRMAGEHQAVNAAAAVTAAVALGHDLEGFIDRMQQATGSAWRMEVHVGDVTVVNDSYNSNPQSLEAALRTVSRMHGRHIAVLGPMAELGPVCEREHRRLGSLVSDLGYQHMFVIGPDHGYALGAPDLVRNATDIGQCLDTLSHTLQRGDVVLVKASRSAGFERLALHLIKDFSL
jgi:UDP-N-acetylmuramoyl-tripeptide--D-alanyl-D-alanine ligase